MSNDKKLKYELPKGVVEYILKALNRVQIAGISQAKDLLTVTELLQNPSNAAEMQKEEYEQLKNKFEPKGEPRGEPEGDPQTAEV